MHEKHQQSTLVQPTACSIMPTNTDKRQGRALLVLHGSRQVGTLLVGRMDKLRKRLSKSCGMKLVAPDGPFEHPEDAEMRQWWNRDGGCYGGLEMTLDLIQQVWKEYQPEGILGFSQGARLAHLLAQCHESPRHALDLQGLSYVIMCAGYDAPVPSNLVDSVSPILLNTRSLHIWGKTDKLIVPASSQVVMKSYRNPVGHEHDGGHHVPMRAANVAVYIDFIEANAAGAATSATNSARANVPKPPVETEPDKENRMAQQDEVEALSTIFPDEFTLLSKQKTSGEYEFPISYRIDLTKSNEGIWPPHALALKMTYPFDYPSDSIADIVLEHENNMMEFSSGQMQSCLLALEEAAELGTPSVMSCLYAARDFFESGAMATNNVQSTTNEQSNNDDGDVVEEQNDEPSGAHSGLIKPASAQRIHECNLQGLEIARQVLEESSNEEEADSKGGIWKYTLGLVGKPSAGKSTFFNAATAFARQKDDADNAIGGATMAPHPFTTIDPNIGHCLVPAPTGSCPEDVLSDFERQAIGCTHGRDHLKRRLIPVLLKDVAGLVPGAYQGRGRGNKFLNDLTDADVLIHVVDASGTSDAEGNAGGTSTPLADLAWILNELIEWVYNNVLFKWDSIQRKGRSKLLGMFSGYGQSRAILAQVFSAVERYMQVHETDLDFDSLSNWDQGDLHRLVSAFLGVRFPMTLALNKKDLAPSKAFIQEVQDALPVHGAHIGVPMSARSDMSYVKQHLLENGDTNAADPPERVWQCLQSALMLKEPLLVFPVSDMTSYLPLPAMFRSATQDPSLPSAGMTACLAAAGGETPTLWDAATLSCLTTPDTSNNKNVNKLRDVLVMKPGSTVEDVFLSLKRQGALGGEFVRAEGAGEIGEKAKLVPKQEVVTKATRILKIMTNKRREWQQK